MICGFRLAPARRHANAKPQAANRSATMSQPAIVPPTVDPTPIFEIFRGSYATELLTAAVAHFNLFGRLAQEPLTSSECLAL